MKTGHHYLAISLCCLALLGCGTKKDNKDNDSAAPSQNLFTQEECERNQDRVWNNGVCRNKETGQVELTEQQKREACQRDQNRYWEKGQCKVRQQSKGNGSENGNGVSLVGTNLIRGCDSQHRNCSFLEGELAPRQKVLSNFTIHYSTISCPVYYLAVGLTLEMKDGSIRHYFQPNPIENPLNSTLTITGWGPLYTRIFDPDMFMRTYVNSDCQITLDKVEVTPF
jgi:hypothetical protein